MASLFLNAPFWLVHGLNLPMYGLLPAFAILLAVVALLQVVLFYVGPALAAQAARCSWWQLLAHSVGSLPARGLRVCGAFFLTLWIANLLALSDMFVSDATYWQGNFRLDILTYKALLMAYLFLTGVQGKHTSAKMALFTNKLNVAVLVAAFVRVRDGWPALTAGLFTITPEDTERLVNSWSHGFRILAATIAPVLLLAAGGSLRSSNRKQAFQTALMGIALPLWGTLLLTGVICVATGNSFVYQPSLQPSVGMALMGRTAESWRTIILFVVFCTTFGALRFGARELAGVLPQGLSRWPRLMVFGCLCLVTAWLEPFRFDDYFFEVSAGLSTGLTLVTAVLTADYMARHRPAGPVPRIELVGTTAWLTGWLVFCWIWNAFGSYGRRQQTGLLPAYAATFAVCLIGRMLQKRFSPPVLAALAPGSTPRSPSACPAIKPPAR